MNQSRFNWANAIAFLAVGLLVATGCGKGGSGGSTGGSAQPQAAPPAAPAPPTTPAGPTASGATNPSPAAQPLSSPAPAGLVELKPTSVAASTFWAKGKERHPPEFAFDENHETAWNEGAPGPGNGEWIEARFDASRRIRRVILSTGYDAVSKKAGDLFPLNSHLKSLVLLFDGGKTLQRDVAEDQREVDVADLDIESKSVRLLAVSVWPGSKWKDLCISEIMIWGDGDAALNHPTAELPLPSMFSPFSQQGFSWLFLVRQIESNPAEDGTMKDTKKEFRVNCHVAKVHRCVQVVAAAVECESADGMLDVGLANIYWVNPQGIWTGGDFPADEIACRRVTSHRPLLSNPPEAYTLQQSDFVTVSATRQSRRTKAVTGAEWCISTEMQMGDPGGGSICFAEAVGISGSGDEGGPAAMQHTLSTSLLSVKEPARVLVP